MPILRSPEYRIYAGGCPLLTASADNNQTSMGYSFTPVRLWHREVLLTHHRCSMLGLLPD